MDGATIKTNEKNTNYIFNSTSWETP